MTANFAGNLTHVAQVARAVGLGRRAHADKGAVGIGNAVFQTGGKRKATVGAAVAHHGFKTRLKNMHGTSVELFDHSGVNVHAGHGIAHFSKACGTNKTNVACSDDAQLHNKVSPFAPTANALTFRRGTGQNSLG